MASIAIFNSKGGVGKTTLAVNLAWEAARDGYRTLLWEVDEQGDSSWILAADPAQIRADLFDVMNDIRDLRHYIRPSKIANLDTVAGDPELRRTDNFFVQYSRQQRLGRMIADLKRDYDVVILDCAPGFSEANRRILLLADLIVVPLIPAALSMRGMLRIRDFLTRHRGAHPAMLPVFSMVDRRRTAHKAALADHPDWPAIPMVSEIEQMTQRRQPVGAFAPNGASAALFRQLWSGIERKLANMHVLRQTRVAAE